MIYLDILKINTLRGDNMKKIIFLFILFFLPIMVYAEEYSVKTMLPIDTKVSVKTEKFDYNNFVYNTAVDIDGNSLITFESIKNNTISKIPISINVLLFGEDSRNIGYVTYCTDKDLDSNYSGYKIKGYDSVPFSIKVVSKYFAKGKSAKDVRFVSIYDENKYCQIGGYDKYAGLTLDEIVNGVGNKKSGIDKIIQYVQDNNLGSIIVISLVALIVLVIIIMVISSIIKRAKNNKFISNDVVNDTEPVEETINLSYGDVSDNNNLEEETSISMGEVSNNTENNDSIESDDNKEDDQDLTSFFN